MELHQNLQPVTISTMTWKSPKREIPLFWFHAHEQVKIIMPNMRILQLLSEEVAKKMLYLFSKRLQTSSLIIWKMKLFHRKIGTFPLLEVILIGFKSELIQTPNHTISPHSKYIFEHKIISMWIVWRYDLWSCQIKSFIISFYASMQ